MTVYTFLFATFWCLINTQLKSQALRISVHIEQVDLLNSVLYFA